MIRFCLATMGRVACLTLLAIALAPVHAAQHPKSSTKKVTPAAKHATPVGNRSGAHHASSAHVAVSSRNASRRRSARTVRAKAAPGPSYQLHPDPERYQVIQRALADRGYFKGEANGTWGDDSVDAMRRFQTDQKLDDDGKIDSLSLIALGLGPRHDGTTAAEPRVPPVPADSETGAPVSSITQSANPVAGASGGAPR